MPHFIAELWIATAVVMTAVALISYLALQPRLSRYALPILGITFMAAAAVLAATAIHWLITDANFD